MIIKAGAQVRTVLLNDVGGDLMALFADMPGFVLEEALRGRFARHPHIETLQYPIKLWIGGPEFCVFIEGTFRELYNVDFVSEFRQGGKVC